MWNIVFFHTRDLRHCRTSPECELELPERLIGAFSQHFDGAVGQVLGPASQPEPVCRLQDEPSEPHTLHPADRKSTRLNSSHSQISYAVFCLKKKKEE